MIVTLFVYIGVVELIEDALLLYLCHGLVDLVEKLSVVLCDNTCVLFCLERLVKNFKVRVLLYKGLCNLAVDNDCIELTLL